MVSCSLKIACSRSFMHTHCMRWAFLWGFQWFHQHKMWDFNRWLWKCWCFATLGCHFYKRLDLTRKELEIDWQIRRLKHCETGDTHNIDPKNLIGGLSVFNVLFQFFGRVHQPGCVVHNRGDGISGISHAPQIDRNAFFPWLSTVGSFLCI